MHARVVTIFIQPDKMDEGHRLLHESMWQETREQPGYKGGLLLEDRNRGRFLSITL
jgi:hypothetical protein